MNFTNHLEIEVKDKPFTVNSKVVSSKTVETKILNSLDKVIDVRYFGYTTTEEVFEKIKSGEKVILDHLYIKNISLNEYRKKYQIGETELITINGFSAQNAFLDCDTGTDFSFASFEGGDIDFSNSFFGTGVVNFYKAQFGSGVVNFSNCWFGQGNINFQFTEFGEGDVLFPNSKFGLGNVSFINAVFGNGNVSFEEVDFGGGDVSFHYSAFGEGDISFHKTKFADGYVDYRRVDFGKGKVDFKRANFGDGDISFEESEFSEGKVTFRGAVFGEGSVSFELAKFGDNDEVVLDKVDFGEGKVSFYCTTFGDLSFKGCHLSNYLDLRIDKGNSINLSDTIVTNIIDVKPHKNARVLLNFLNITSMRNLGRIFIDWKKNNVYDLIANQQDTSLQEKAEQFRTLKEDFNSTGLYDDEDKAYVEFKRFEMRANQQAASQKNIVVSTLTWLKHAFQNIVFDRMGLYATSPIRVLGSMVIVYLIFSIVYLVLPEIVDAGIACTGADNDHISFFKRTFYYSAITFLTIGYGDCLPQGHIHWIAPLEGWIGVFMMSYFTVAFVRKVLR